jgi:hypothetical protein
MRLYEFDLSQSETLMGFWELAELMGLSKHAQEIDDLCLPWVNNNRPSCITKLMSNKKYREASLLKLYWETNFKGHSWAEPRGSYAGFQAWKASPMTFWRGGGGKYDPNYTGNGWFAYTYKKDRVQAFTDYHGTYASQSTFLKKRKGDSWIIELTIPVGELALYVPCSMDSEVIIPASLSATAKQIR